MGIRRDMIKLNMVVRKQGCRITRWKLTATQAKALSPNMHFYDRMLAGKAQFFAIQVKVKS